MLERKLMPTVALAILAATSALVACGGEEGEEAGAGEPTVITGAGEVGPQVERFRELLGPDNGGAPGGDREGRRELTWDGVPDELAAPNALPGNFFNGTEDPTARGALLRTPGDHVAVSADADNPSAAAVRFGDVNPGYGEEFVAFSEERLFSPIGSNVVELSFAVPGTKTPALTRGFGAVYTDIDREENTAFEYFDASGASLGKFAAPVADGGLSFLGVDFGEPIVARVRIEYGSGELGPAESAGYDVAVMDDFIYGEPHGDAAAAASQFVGRVEGTDAYIGLVSDGERLSGYVCDGADVSVWLEAPLAGSAAELVGRDGEALGRVELAGARASGEVELGGEAHSFEAKRASLGGGAGLYREASAGFPARGSRESGWIVLADGSVRGRTQVMNPDLDSGAPPSPKPSPGTKIMDPDIDF
ncbi:MAG: hypothetical protein ACRDKH_03010 [Solirubrobacterales bacterium]